MPAECETVFRRGLARGRGAAMPRVSHHFVVSRPIDAVFDVVTTARFWTEWHPATRGVEGDVDHPARLGAPGPAVGGVGGAGRERQGWSTTGRITWPWKLSILAGGPAPADQLSPSLASRACQAGPRAFSSRFDSVSIFSQNLAAAGQCRAYARPSPRRGPPASPWSVEPSSTWSPRPGSSAGAPSARGVEGTSTTRPGWCRITEHVSIAGIEGSGVSGAGFGQVGWGAGRGRRLGSVRSARARRRPAGAC